MSLLSAPRTRRTAIASLASAAALTALIGVGPVPAVLQLSGATEDVRGNCDEAEHANDPGCVGGLSARGVDDDDDDGDMAGDGTTSTTSTTTNGGMASAAAEVRTIQAGDAGSIMVAVDGANLQLLMASPNPGWRVEIEHASGLEVEVTFRSGSVRVDVDVEFEDGQVRERVRIRDDAAGTELRLENGVVVREEGPDADDDNSGPGNADDVDDADDADDNSGPGNADDDDADDDDADADDDDNSGSGSHSDDDPDHD